MTVDPVTPTSLNVTWDPAPNAVHYIVEWEPDSGNEYTETEFYLAEDLEECEKYTFTVSAYSSTGGPYRSESASEKTSAAGMYFIQVCVLSRDTSNFRSYDVDLMYYYSAVIMQKIQPHLMAHSKSGSY